MTCMTTVMTEELQVTAQLVGVMPRGHSGVLSTTHLVWLGILLVFVCGRLRTTRPSQIKPMHLCLKPWTHSPSRYLAVIRDLTYRSFELCSRWPRICPVFKS